MTATSVSVLVAEDNADVAEVLQALLASEAGFTCVGSVPDAESVLDAVARLEPRVLLLDLELQGVSGMQVLQDCRRCHPALTVIIVSGHSSPSIIRAAKQGGAADFLIKPEDLPALTSRIRQALSADSQAGQ